MATSPQKIAAAIGSHVVLPILVGLISSIVFVGLANVYHSHTRSFWIFWAILVIATIATECFVLFNEHQAIKPEIYPHLQEGKKIQNRLLQVSTRIDALTSKRDKRITPRPPANWIYRFKLARLKKQANCLRRQLKPLHDHLREFGGDEAVRIQEVLKLAGWNVEPGEITRLDSAKTEFVVNEGEPPNQRSILVHFVPGEASLADWEELSQAMATLKSDEAWLIAERYYSENQSSPEHTEVSRNPIRIFKPEELFFQKIFKLDGYFDWLTRDCSRLKVSGHNVPISGIIPTYSEDFQHEIESRRIESVDDYITDWSSRPGRNHIAMLGDFGTGKSWFCLQYAGKQLVEYARKPDKERIPLLIPLGNYKDIATDKELDHFGEPEVLIKLFCETHHIDQGNYELFDHFNRQGRFLIIFDGLDEIVSAGDQESLTAICQRIAKFAVNNGKLILTSRRSVFNTSTQRRSLLGLDNRFEVIRLDRFDPDRIKNFIRLHAPKHWRAYWEKLSANRSIMELASRPIMLNIILDGFKLDLGFDPKTTVADLYERYTDFWIENVGRKLPGLDESRRRQLMQTLAWKMFEQGRSQVHYSELRSLLSEPKQVAEGCQASTGVGTGELVALVNGLAPGASEEISGTDEADALTRSFLVRNASGHYFFAHPSFRDYFVAKKLSRDLIEGRKEGFAKKLPPEVISFLACFDLDSTVMLSWIREARGQESYLAGNLLTVLNKKGADLTRQDFSGLCIKEADLSRANLEGSNFTGCTLTSVDVADCRLTNADFSGAKLLKLILGVRSAAKSVAFSPNGKYITSGRDDNGVALFDKARDEWKLHKVRNGHEDSIASVTFSRDSRLLASSGFDRTIIIWKLNGEKCVKLPKHEFTVYDVEFTPDGKYLFSAFGNSIKLWRITDSDSRDVMGHEISVFTEHADRVYKLAVNARGDYLATASFDNTIGIWKIKQSAGGTTLEFVNHLKGHQSLVNGVSFSPIGSYLASASNDKGILIWALDEQKLVKRLDQHTDIVWEVAYSSSGRYIVSGSLDKTVKVWDLRNERVVTLTGHLRNVWSVCFSPDERLVASGSFDGTVRIWDWRQGICLQTLQLGGSAKQKFDCAGMKLTRDNGLSPLQEAFLLELGAKMEKC